MTTQRKLALAVLAMITLALAGHAWAAKKPSSRIRPTSSAGTVKILIGKKKSAYNAATALKPVEFTVKGPVTIRVMSRYLLPAGSTGKSGSYRYRVEVGTTVLRTDTKKIVVSKSAQTTGGRKVGTLQKSIIRFPKGDHRVRIIPVDREARIAVRVLKGTGKKAAIRWTDYQPDAGAKPFRLHTKDRESTVYRFTPTEPIHVTVRGALKMRVSTRLDFGLANGYTQTYVIKTSLDGKPWKSFNLKTTASHTTTYPDLREVTPGQGRLFVLDVPSGSHTIAIELTGTTAGGACAKIQIPRSAVGEASE